jgi:hypothetical protein
MAGRTPLRPAELRDAADTARELAKLKEHPSWDVLRSEFEGRRRRYLDNLARSIAAGGIDADPLNQRAIDYQRGFLRGAQAVLDSPENAIEHLERVLRKEGKESA